MKRKYIILSIFIIVFISGLLSYLFLIRPRIVSSSYSKAETYMDKKEYALAQKELDYIYKLDSRYLKAYILNYKIYTLTEKNENEIFEFVKKAYKKTKNQYFKNLLKDYESLLTDLEIPKLNFQSGNYSKEFIVKIINLKDNEQAYYVLNGEKKRYEGAITIPSGRTRLVVYKNKNGKDSKGKEYIFYVGDLNEKTVFSHSSGVYENEFFLIATSEGEIFYTLDGSEPSETSQKYTSPIKIKDNTVFKYFCKTNDTSTATFTKYYIFNDNTMQSNSLSYIETSSEKYYINSKEGFSVYKDNSRLASLSASDLCFSDDELFFISRDYKNGIYKISKDGGLEKNIFNKNASLLKNIGKFLFYIDSDSGSLWLCDNNGKNSIKLYDNISSYVIKNDSVYFTRENILYKSKLFSFEEQKLLEDVKEFDVTSDEKIYYTKSSGGLYEKSDETETSVCEENVTSFAVSPFKENLICYNSNNILYFNDKEIKKGFIYSLSFSQNNINYYLLDENGEDIQNISLTE